MTELDTVKSVQAPLTPQDIKQANVVLKIAYDESDAKVEAEVLIDGEIVEGIDETGQLALFLPLGDYDLQVKSTTLRAAARQKIHVTSSEKIEQNIWLKSEALGLVGEPFDIRIIGADKDGSVNLSQDFKFAVFDEGGLRLPFNHVSNVIIRRIEAGTFKNNVGGYGASRSMIIREKFKLDGTTAYIADMQDFRELIAKFGVGEFDIEVDVYDSVNDRIYHSVLFFAPKIE